MRELTPASLALVLPHQEVLKKISQKLQRNILESESRSVEQLEKVDVVVEVHERSGLGRTEGCVTCVDDLLEVGARNLGLRDVERHDLKSQLREAQVLPALPG